MSFILRHGGSGSICSDWSELPLYIKTDREGDDKYMRTKSGKEDFFMLLLLQNLGETKEQPNGYLDKMFSEQVE